MRKSWMGVLFGLGFAAVCLGGCMQRRQEYIESQTWDHMAEEQSGADKKAEDEKNHDNDTTGDSNSQGRKKMKIPDIPKDEYPNIDGSTATLPLSQALYRLVTEASEEEAQAMVNHTKTTNAYNRLIDGGYLADQNPAPENRVDLVIAYEPAKSVYDAMESTGIRLKIKPIGKDALVFLANEGNPVDSLTEKQLVDIYHGTIRNWSEVGGEEKEIVAFQRPEGSGSQTLMQNLVMKEVAMDPKVPTVQVIGDMGELIDQVASYNNERNALGYSVYFYARNMYKSPELRLMKVNGVLPSNETIRSGEYPYVNEFYAAVREDEPKDSRAYQLFEWLTTEDGQTLIEGLGYVGVEEPEEDIRFPEILKQESEPVKGTLSMKENERFLINRYFAYQKDGIVMLGPDMKEEGILHGVKLGGQVELVSIDDPVILKNQEEKFGLYDIQNEKWLLEPEYQYLERFEDGSYKGTISKEEGVYGEYLITWDPKLNQYQAQQASLEGDCLWRWNPEKTKAVITDRQGNLVREVDLEVYGNLMYGYFPYDDVERPWYQTHFEAGSHDMMFDERGNILLERDMVDVDSGEQMQISAVTQDRRLVELMFGSEDYIYDLQQKQIVSQPGEETDMTWDGQQSFYSRNGIWYDTDGTMLVSADGTPYERVMGDGYFSYYKDGILVIEGHRETYRIPADEDDARYASHITGNLFQTGSQFYQGETRRPELDGCYYGESDSRIVLKNGTGFNLIMDQNNQEIYRSDLKEDILSVEERYLTARRGSYFCVLDYQGQVVFQCLMESMTDD